MKQQYNHIPKIETDVKAISLAADIESAFANEAEQINPRSADLISFLSFCEDVRNRAEKALNEKYGSDKNYKKCFMFGYNRFRLNQGTYKIFSKKLKLRKL